MEIFKNMKIKVYKYCSIEKSDKDVYQGADIYLLPSLQFYYRFNKFSKPAYDGEPQIIIYFRFLLWEIEFQFLHHENKN